MWDDGPFPGDRVGGSGTGGWRRLDGEGRRIEHHDDADLTAAREAARAAAEAYAARQAAQRPQERHLTVVPPSDTPQPEPEHNEPSYDPELAVAAVTKYAQAGAPWAIRMVRRWSTRDGGGDSQT